MAREAVRLDASKRGKRDGILQAADQPGGRARQPGRDLTPDQVRGDGPAGVPVIVTVLFGDADFAWLDRLRREHYPPERNRVPAHLTLFHHLPPGIEAELSARLAAYTATAPPRAHLAGVIDLGEGTALRVESEELEDIRADLADAFRTLLMPQDRAPWRPHVTIQNKVEPREARRLQQRLRATFEPRPLRIKGIASWRYLDGPWQPLKTHSFRG